jgi:uncharacterized protein YutE (UPF0331/DUF86 family)
MNISNKRKLVFQQLEESLEVLGKALESLQYSFSKCSSIIDKDELNQRDQERFEALTSRFARTADILTQKVIKTLFFLVQERPKTFLDSANLLEKLEIIEHAEDIINIRELRNQISHEYVIDDLRMLFSDVMKFVPELEKIITKVDEYIGKHLKGSGQRP